MCWILFHWLWLVEVWVVKESRLYCAVSLANWLNTDLKGQCINTSQGWNVNIVSWLGKTDYRRRNERLKIGEQEIEAEHKLALISATTFHQVQQKQQVRGSTLSSKELELNNSSWHLILLLFKVNILILLLMAKE